MHSNSLKLISREEIQRRLARMVGEPNVRRLDQVTRSDVAKWIGVEERLIRMHQNGLRDITDAMQIIYSQLFALLDSGELELRFTNHGKKTLVRVPKPETPPVKKTLKPFVDLTTMRLGLDT